MPKPLPNLLPPLLIISLTLLAYANAFHGYFIFDDLEAIIANPHVKQIFPLTYSMSTPPQSPIAARPVVSLTFALNWAMTPNNPVSFHATNIAIHICTGLLVCALTRFTLATAPVARRLPLTDLTRTLLATAAGLLFTLHPLNNECVNYIMQRTESMMALFSLLTLYCLTKAVRPTPAASSNVGSALADVSSFSPPTSSSSVILHPSSLAWSLAAMLSSALAMGCKEVAVATPVLVLLYDRLFLSNSWRNLIKRHYLPHLLIFSTYAVLAYILWDNPRSETSNFSMSQLTPWNYLKTQAGVLVFYLRMAVVPHPLSVDYYDWPLATHLTGVLPQALLICALLAATFYALYKNHPLAIVGIYFFFTLAPTSSIIPLAGENASERRMYLPMAAIAPATVLAIYLLIRRFAPAPRRLQFSLFLAVTIAFLFIYADQRRNEAYATDISIWEDTVAKRPRNGRAWANLGASYLRVHDYQAAADASAQSVKFDPGLPTARRNLAVALLQLHHPQQALPEFRRALAFKGQDHAPTRAGYARALLESGQPPDKAFHQFDLALKLDPDNATIHNDYGFALAQSGHFSDAIPHFRRALELDPKLADAHFNLALAHEAVNDFRSAVEELHRAIDLQPQNPQPLDHLAWLRATHPDPNIRNPNEAITLAGKSLQLHASDPATALDTLAAAQAAAGDFPSAISAATQARDLAAQSRPPLATQIEKRLALYRAGKPYVQPERPSTTQTTRPTTAETRMTKPE